MIGALVWRVKNGVCAMRVDNLPGFELGFWFSTLVRSEFGKDASEVEDTSADPDACVFELKAFRPLKKEVLRAMPDVVGRWDRAVELVGMFATTVVRRRLKVLVANLLSVSEKEDFRRSGNGRCGGFIAASISAALSASSVIAISVARFGCV